MSGSREREIVTTNQPHICLTIANTSPGSLSQIEDGMAMAMMQGVMRANLMVCDEYQNINSDPLEWLQGRGGWLFIRFLF